MVSSGALLALRHCKRNKQKQKAAENVGTSSNKDNPQPPEPSCSYTSQNLNLKSEQIEYSILCRVCLNHGNIPIYGPEDLSEELNSVAGIHVIYNDAFPKYLCQPCCDLLQGAMLLKKTAQASEQFLRQHHKNAPQTVIDNNDHLDNAINSPIEPLSFEDEDNFEEKKDVCILKPKIKIKVEIEKKPTYHCVRCDLNFDLLDKYQEHLLTEEHDNPKKVCPICHKSYNYMYLKRHMVLHEGKQAYRVCDVCGKYFPHHRLNRHRITHFITELPFKCSLCPYRGRFNESLKMHMKSHTGEKLYHCPQCPSRHFVNKSNLSRHMLTHKREHDFKCSQCSRGFYSKRELDLHYKVDHTGIKDFLCNLCGKSFGYRKQMMKHQLKVHKRAKCMPGRTPLYVLMDEKEQHQEETIENTF